MEPGPGIWILNPRDNRFWFLPGWAVRASHQVINLILNLFEIILSAAHCTYHMSSLKGWGPKFELQTVLRNIFRSRVSFSFTMAIRFCLHIFIYTYHSSISITIRILDVFFTPQHNRSGKPHTKIGLRGNNIAPFYEHLVVIGNSAL